MTYLVAGKILWSTEIKFEVAEKELCLLMKAILSKSRSTDVQLKEHLLCIYGHSAIKVIKVLR